MTTPTDSTYTVRLPDYEGPLDLLLHLIEREELDITRLSLAQVTDQYMQYLNSMQRADAAQIAEFLVVAAKLLLIKSNLLLPQEPVAGEEPSEDVGEELTRQLLEYRRYKQVALELKAWEGKGLRAYARIAPRPKVVPQLDLSNVSLDDLSTLLEVVLAAQRRALVGDVVAPLVIRVSDKLDDLQQRLARGERVRFRQWLAAATSRIEIIVSFLAVLELIKQRKVIVSQPELFGDILIESAPETTGSAPAITVDAEDEPSFVEPQS